MANEFLDGELNCSFFEAREAKSKLKYFARIGSMSDTRWPRAMRDMIELYKFKTKLRSRTEELSHKHGCNLTVMNGDERFWELIQST